MLHDGQGNEICAMTMIHNSAWHFVLQQKDACDFQYMVFGLDYTLQTFRLTEAVALGTDTTRDPARALQPSHLVQLLQLFCQAYPSHASCVNAFGAASQACSDKGPGFPLQHL